MTVIKSKKGTEFDNDPSNRPLIDQFKSADLITLLLAIKTLPKPPLLLNIGKKLIKIRAVRQVIRVRKIVLLERILLLT